ncbi:MAG: glycosyltransferase [Candidatus Aenigmatarchaeota archaeon]|uniref:Glycosyltransferase n=1 Tax=Fervidobacterium pennivorans TaxID=93466 RepID=A0A7C4VVG3_FERPE
MKPKVTIGICVRNGASTLREAIESVMAQDYPHELMEVIFVDDGSTDNTLSIIKDYASKMDMKVKIFHHEWKGLGFSRNVVVKNAGGKYIIWVDCDMILPKDHVQKQVEFMEKNPKVGIGKARYGFIDENSMVAFLEHMPFMVYDSKAIPLDLKLPGTGGAIFRVEAIRKVGGFDERLKGVGEDQEIAFRVKTNGWQIKRTNAYFYERRVKSWIALWRKYFWYGYGNYHLYRKKRGILSPTRMNPVAGFLAGCLYIAESYRLTHRKAVFLLPIHFAFKMIAWCYGFANAQLKAMSKITIF